MIYSGLCTLVYALKRSSTARVFSLSMSFCHHPTSPCRRVKYSLFEKHRPLAVHRLYEQKSFSGKVDAVYNRVVWNLQATWLKVKLSQWIFEKARALKLSLFVLHQSTWEMSDFEPLFPFLAISFWKLKIRSKESFIIGPDFLLYLKNSWMTGWVWNRVY